MKQYTRIYTLLLMLVFNISFKEQNKTNLSKDDTRSKTVITSLGPNSGIRNIKQDKKGNIWIATNDGIFKYDGGSFTNITSKITSTPFSSILEDRRGNFWFASFGSGVFYYNGTSFRNFTTRDGLANNGVLTIYEDKTGNIWFGGEGGVSRYDGKSFRNFSMKEILSNNNFATIINAKTLESIPNIITREKQPNNSINSVLEDQTGKFWFSTRREVYVYNGETFTVFRNKDGNPFMNVRTIIEDKKGNIWLGGQDGLWRYDGNTFTNFTENFVGQVYEDKKGNIWTTSVRANGSTWILSRYDEKSLSDIRPTVTQINPNSGRLIFGIFEANDGNIWFGSGGVLYRYDGNTVIPVNSFGIKSLMSDEFDFPSSNC